MSDISLEKNLFECVACVVLCVVVSVICQRWIVVQPCGINTTNKFLLTDFAFAAA